MESLSQDMGDSDADGQVASIGELGDSTAGPVGTSCREMGDSGTTQETADVREMRRVTPVLHRRRMEEDDLPHG